MTEQTDGTQESSGEHMLPTYVRGAWVATRFPIPDNGGWDDYDQFKRDGGYSEFARIGRSGTAPIALSVWRGVPAEGDAEYLIEVDGPFDGSTVGAGDIADLVDLLSRWAPIMQAVALTRIVDDARFDGADVHGLEYNAFAAIGALMAEGRENRMGWAARHQRRAEEARRRAQEARSKAAGGGP